jgi:hypothetical protein
MKTRTLIIGGLAVVVLGIGGWALAQVADHGPMRNRPMGMHRMHVDTSHEDTNTDNRRPGSQRMMHNGHGMMGMGHGTATAGEHEDIHALFDNHEKIKRKVVNLPDGIRTLTESDDAETAAIIKRHVAEMGKRVEDGRNPRLPIQSAALNLIFKNKDKIKSKYEMTDKGVIVVQTSTDAATVKALQDHAAEVSDLAKRGISAAHDAMMKNAKGMMNHGMHGPSDRKQHSH